MDSRSHSRKLHSLAPMALVHLWSDLPTDIILHIQKILASDFDTIRLRSVCSHWRSSIPRRYRPSPFPLHLPPLFSDHFYALLKGIRFFLHYSTVCRISPPNFGPYAGDPSDGFLLRVLEVRPNTFSLLPLLRFSLPKSDLTPAPKQVNLLDFRVSEICKGYGIECTNPTENEDIKSSLIRKVIVLWNYDVDCEFAVLVLFKPGLFCCWKFGDEDWFGIKTGNHKLDDLVLCDGKCYAITTKGVLLFLDSKFNLIVAPSLTRLPVDCNQYDRLYLMEYKSELYVMSTYYDVLAHLHCIAHEEIALEVKIFKKSHTTWELIESLGDNIFLFFVDQSFGLSIKDFSDCKGNCVYLSPEMLLPYRLRAGSFEYGVHYLDEGRTFIRKWGGAHTLICRPPPKWLLSS